MTLLCISAATIDSPLKELTTDQNVKFKIIKILYDKIGEILNKPHFTFVFV